MVEIRKPIQVSEAVRLVMAQVRVLGVETISLENSYGRILAEPIIAKHDVPPFARSTHDGFAVRAKDTVGAYEDNGIPFTVIGEIGAGSVAKCAIGRGEAFRIMTGAPIPDNADAVVMLEHTLEEKGSFTLRASVSQGENISFKGEDAKDGECLIETGTIIHPGTIALLATFGYAEVQVGKRPIVGILSTGTELLAVSDKLVPGKIRNSNGPMIAAQLTRMGIVSTSYGMQDDDINACIQTVKKALSETDVLITTGGVSVGDYDYLPVIYERLGAEVLFNKVAMRPGSVTTVAVLGDKLLFGLSGNPSACFTGFELFTRPAILAMQGAITPYIPRMQATLGENFEMPNPFTRFIRGFWALKPGGVVVTSAGFNKSNAVSSIARGNCLLLLPSGKHVYNAGTTIDILLLGAEQGVGEWG